MKILIVGDKSRIIHLKHFSDKLKKFGALFINNPTIGRLASGLYGKGRLPEIELIIDEMRFLFNKNGDLKGRNVVITAGGTREAIDPVRYISNESSGKMGHESWPVYFWPKTIHRNRRGFGLERTLVRNTPFSNWIFLKEVENS